MGHFSKKAIPVYLALVKEKKNACDYFQHLFSAFLISSGYSCGVWTKGGNGNGECCVFPFSYHGVNYFTCTYQDHSNPWCAVTSDFDQDGVWGECIGNRYSNANYAIWLDSNFNFFTL